MLRVGTLCLFVLLSPSLVFAQDPDPDRWGIGVSFVPKWDISSGSGVFGKLAEAMFTEGESGLDVNGGDFRVGIVRGRRFGGEWGVSYVRRSFDSDSTQGAVQTECFDSGFPNSQICQTFGFEYLYGDNVVLDGIEVNKLIVISTIRRVVQVGVDIGGGVGWMKGTVTERESMPINAPIFPQPNTTIVIPTVVTDRTVPASTLVAVDPVPIGRVELVGGVILGPNVKVRVSGGLNIPGVHVFSVSATVFLP